MERILTAIIELKREMHEIKEEIIDLKGIMGRFENSLNQIRNDIRIISEQLLPDDHLKEIVSTPVTTSEQKYSLAAKPSEE